MNDDFEWSKTIKGVLKIKKKRLFEKNAYNTAKKYTWDLRCKKIISFTKIKKSKLN